MHNDISIPDTVLSFDIVPEIASLIKFIRVLRRSDHKIKYRFLLLIIVSVLKSTPHMNRHYSFRIIRISSRYIFPLSVTVKPEMHIGQELIFSGLNKGQKDNSPSKR